MLSVYWPTSHGDRERRVIALPGTPPRLGWSHAAALIRRPLSHHLLASGRPAFAHRFAHRLAGRMASHLCDEPTEYSRAGLQPDRTVWPNLLLLRQQVRYKMGIKPLGSHPLVCMCRPEEPVWKPPHRPIFSGPPNSARRAYWAPPGAGTRRVAASLTGSDLCH
jgi:hypothetical protein